MEVTCVFFKLATDQVVVFHWIAGSKCGSAFRLGEILSIYLYYYCKFQPLIRFTLRLVIICGSKLVLNFDLHVIDVCNPSLPLYVVPA